MQQGDGNQREGVVLSERRDIDRMAQAREGAQEGTREWLRMLENLAQQIQKQ